VITQQQVRPSGLRHLELIILMGSLQALAPLSIDMYLPSMPLLEGIFHASTAAVQATLITFFLGYALGQSLYGPVTDRFGRKPPLYFSLLLFLVSSAICALAPTVQLLALFRLFQALGACGGAVMSRAMVRDLFPPEDLRRIFSMLVLVIGVSPLVAPLIGGYLLLWFGWQSIFWLHTLLAAAALLGVYFRLAESMAPGAARPLHASLILSTYSRLFRDRAFLGASLVCGFSSAGMFAYIASAPFVFISLYKVSPQRFGWLFGAIALGLITASQVNGRMSYRISLSKVLRNANLVQLAAGLLLLGAALTGIGGPAAVFLPVFVYMCAAGFVFPNGTTLAMTHHAKIAGTESALLGTNQFFIAAVSTTVLALIETSSALPMAIVIAGCGIAATLLNFLTLSSRAALAAET